MEGAYLYFKRVIHVDIVSIEWFVEHQIQSGAKNC